MQIRTSFKIFAMLAVFAFVAMACSDSSSTVPGGGGDTTSTSTSTSSSSSESSSEGGDDEHETLDVSGKSTAEMEADDEEGDFYFKPATLTGTAGQTITLTVHNEGSADHTFTIDDQDVDVQLSPDQEQDVTVTFPDSGTVEFYCRFHVSLGMKGELKVA